MMALSLTLRMARTVVTTMIAVAHRLGLMPERTLDM